MYARDRKTGAGSPMSAPMIARTKAELRALLAERRPGGRTVGFVPTMGSLHEGHLSLLRAARERCDIVVLSVFVNPTQFADGEDLDGYPRDEAGDLALAGDSGVEIVFAPDVDEVYPPGFATYVAVEGLTDVLDGDPDRRGAGHFRGVTTIVAKLLNLVAPDVAFLGQKDAQQAIVIRRMARDLDFACEIAVVPTVREPDGLALSSRNSYLTQEERDRAPALWAALEAVRAAASEGATVAAAVDAGRRALDDAGIEPEYLEARHADDLTPAESFNGRPVLVAVAARVGKARLIDNVVVGSAAAHD
jgi:pantoate--beta-alanine ligase